MCPLWRKRKMKALQDNSYKSNSDESTSDESNSDESNSDESNSDESNSDKSTSLNKNQKKIVTNAIITLNTASKYLNSVKSAEKMLPNHKKV